MHTGNENHISMHPNANEDAYEASVAVRTNTGRADAPPTRSGGFAYLHTACIFASPRNRFPVANHLRRIATRAHRTSAADCASTVVRKTTMTRWKMTKTVVSRPPFHRSPGKRHVSAADNDRAGSIWPRARCSDDDWTRSRRFGCPAESAGSRFGCRGWHRRGRR